MVTLVKSSLSVVRPVMPAMESEEKRRPVMPADEVVESVNVCRRSSASWSKSEYARHVVVPERRSWKNVEHVMGKNIMTV